MSARFPVLLDTCILVPAVLRDVLLTAAEAGLYRPLWSPDILDALERTLTGDLGLEPAQASHARQEMEAFFPEALVTGYAHLSASMMNHDGDRHVLAAAVQGGTDIIVTENLRHFPVAACEPHEIEAISTDEFLCDLLDLDAEGMCGALRTLERLRRDLSVAAILTSVSLVAPQFARDAAFRLGLPVR